MPEKTTTLTPEEIAGHVTQQFDDMVRHLSNKEYREALEHLASNVELRETALDEDDMQKELLDDEEDSNAE